jgi:hypothetical protein
MNKRRYLKAKKNVNQSSPKTRFDGREKAHSKIFFNLAVLLLAIIA